MIPGPLTWLYLGKGDAYADGPPTPASSLLENLLPVYQAVLARCAQQGVQWAQIDEPILALDLPQAWRDAFKQVYAALSSSPLKLLVATYFDGLKDNLPTALALPVAGLHVDLVRAPEQLAEVVAGLRADQVLSAGVINGRNIWRTDLDAAAAMLAPIVQLGERLWLAPSCSLLHVPVDLDNETELDAELKSWLSFAAQKLQELNLLGRALDGATDAATQDALGRQRAALAARRSSTRIHNPAVAARMAAAGGVSRDRAPSPAVSRASRKSWACPPIPPPPSVPFRRPPKSRAAPRLEIRRADRLGLRDRDPQGNRGSHPLPGKGRPGRAGARRTRAQRHGGVLRRAAGRLRLHQEWLGAELRLALRQAAGHLRRCGPSRADDGGLVVLRAVADRQAGQGHVDRTGHDPAVVLRARRPAARTDLPPAGAELRDEVVDLEAAGISVIQIDEPAIREGLPLRRADWQAYLDWAVDCFRLSTAGVRDETQIHTHMCYSEFNDIIESIAAMDADVITIETSRSNMELLKAFEDFRYPNDIGPGVYDIHSPNVPEVDWMVGLMQKAAARLPKERLWVNPDCGLKTRAWPETEAALIGMVQAARALRDAA